MLRTTQFWLLFAMYFFGASAGLTMAAAAVRAVTVTERPRGSAQSAKRPATSAPDSTHCSRKVIRPPMAMG